MNKSILIGNLTRDPELSETNSGIAVCRLSLAVSRPYPNADGTRETDFFNIVVWRTKAENCAKYLKKGRKVAVSGTLQNRSYEDKDGIKRTVTEVIAEDVEFLSPHHSDDEPEETVVTARRERPQLEPLDDDQLPF